LKKEAFFEKRDLMLKSLSLHPRKRVVKVLSGVLRGMEVKTMNEYSGSYLTRFAA